MRICAIAISALFLLSGCLSLHADVPESVVRHLAREDGADVGAVCAHEGHNFSEGAIACMADQRMTCGPTGRWVRDGACSG